MTFGQTHEVGDQAHIDYPGDASPSRIAGLRRPQFETDIHDVDRNVRTIEYTPREATSLCRQRR